MSFLPDRVENNSCAGWNERFGNSIDFVMRSDPFEKDGLIALVLDEFKDNS
jgi:hypothetical protein